MNPQLSRLYKSAGRPSRIIIGLMSGTSLDGLDIACCRITGSGLETSFEVLRFTTLSYTDAQKNWIRKVFARPDAELKWVCLLNTWLGKLHGKMLKTQLHEWQIEASDVDLIASHGQTIFHAPAREHLQAGFADSTLQIGDGDQIAFACGIITLSDFRQKHIAAGGEGAPLAVYGEFLLLNKPGVTRFLINIGGISNFTKLPAELKDSVFATDAGPGNTLSDAFIRQRFKGSLRDENGELALKGQILSPLLVELKKARFFSSPFPKTTGPEVFNAEYLNRALSESNQHAGSAEDILATLSQLVADSLFDALVQSGADAGAEYYISGGGVYNQAIMNRLRNKAVWLKSLGSTQTIGLDPDAKEAVIFAALANEAIAGDFSRFKSSFGTMPAVSFGKISFPC